MKLSLRPIWDYCEEMGVKLVGTIHDEVAIYAPQGVSEDVAMRVKEIMEQTVSWPVPIRAEYKVASNWAGAH